MSLREPSRFVVNERLSNFPHPMHTAILVKQDYCTLSRFSVKADDTGDPVIKAVRSMISDGTAKRHVCSACASFNKDPATSTLVTNGGNVAPSGVSTTGSPDAHANLPITNSLHNAFFNKHHFSKISTKIVNLPCHSINTYCDPEFVGRETELTKLGDWLQQTPLVQPKIVLLHGLGGIGKTQTAVQYALKSTSFYSAILFARADDESKVAIDFAEFARGLGLVDSVDKDLVKPRESLKQWFCSTPERWLIVFDNVDSADSLQFLESYLPESGCGSVLITSRKKDLYKILASEEIELVALPEDTAVTLLRSLSPEAAKSHQSQLQSIVGRVDCLPLGIMAAAGAMRNGSYNASEFLDAYEHGYLIAEATQPGKARQFRYPLNLATVWNMEFRRFSEDELLLLNVFACLDARSISEELLLSGAAHCSGQISALLADKKTYLRCRAELYKSSLISWEDTSRQISMHRLVEETCHFRMSVQDAKHVFSFVTSLLSALLPELDDYNRHLTALWPKVRPVIDHVIAFCRHADNPDHKAAVATNPQPLSAGLKHPRTLTDLLYRTAWYVESDRSSPL